MTSRILSQAEQQAMLAATREAQARIGALLQNEPRYQPALRRGMPTPMTAARFAEIRQQAAALTYEPTRRAGAELIAEVEQLRDFARRVARRSGDGALVLQALAHLGDNADPTQAPPAEGHPA